MKSMGKKSKSIYVLLISVVIIWGIVIYKVSDFLLSARFDNMEIKEVKDLSIDVTNHMPLSNSGHKGTYMKIKRDPFIFSNQGVPKKKIVSVINNKSYTEQISYKPKGVIINNFSKLVILEDMSNDTTLFLRVGEQYEGIKILKISADYVRVLEGGKEKDFIIQEL